MSASPPARPARRYGSPTGRIVIPVLFVVLLIVVLGRPILIAGLDLDPEQTEPAPRGGTVTKSPKPEGPSRLAAGYPRACLGDASSPGLGLIAASDGSTVTAASPTGADAFMLQARPPIGFSASGRFLATAGADVWTAQGRHVGLAFVDAVKTWAWSPAADCIAGVDRGRLVVAKPGGKPVTLVDDVDVETFAFSPDGSRILFAVGGSSRSKGLWLADLRTGKVRNLQQSVGWTLAAWTTRGRPLLLRHKAFSTAALSFVDADQTAYCGDEVLTLRGPGPARFGVSGPASYLDVDRGFSYVAMACAPNGNFLAVVRRDKEVETETEIVVLRSDGSLVREVGQGSSFHKAPMWGPSGTGVIFVGEPGGEGAVGPLVWFLPEGGTARPTGLRVSKLGDELDALLDWSATPPLGHPTN